MVSVPVVKEGTEYVKDVLKVKINTEILYKLFIGEQYASNGFDKDPERTTPNADDIVKQIMAFEKEMYYPNDSTVIYHIKDNRLFDNWPADTTKPQDFYIAMKFVTEICSIIEIVYISGWESCNSGKGNSSNITVPKCPIYSSVIINDCYEDNSDGGGWSSYPEGEPGGGGSTTTSPDSTANPPNNLPGECGEDRNWVAYVIDANTGVWKNPCTEEPPPTVPLPDEPPPNPCDSFILFLQNNVNFSTNFKSLLQSPVLNNNVEVGYKINFLTNQFEYVTGEIPTTAGVIGEVDLGSNTALSGTIHTHNLNAATMFSPTDVINQMAKLFLENKAQEPSNLFAAIATQNGPYLIKITDTANFRKMANKIYSPTDSTKANKFLKDNKESFRWLSDSISNEVGFLQMLEKYKKNGGITFYKGNADCNKWSALSYSAILPQSGPPTYTILKQNCF